MRFNFDGKTVDLTPEQMHEVYRAYMKEYTLLTLIREEMLECLSEYAEQYTDDDRQKLSERIADLMESETLHECFYDFVGDCLVEYDKKFDQIRKNRHNPSTSTPNEQVAPDTGKEIPMDELNTDASTMLYVGKKMPELAGPETIDFLMTEFGGFLLIRCRDAAILEKKAFRMQCEFRLVMKDGVIFLPIKMVGMPWNCAICSYHLWPDPDICLDEIRDGVGYAVHMVLCDTDGLIYGLRTISFSTRFSRELKKMALEQRKTPFSVERFKADVYRVFEQYSPRRLAKLATCHCRTGE